MTLFTDTMKLRETTKGNSAGSSKRSFTALAKLLLAAASFGTASTTLAEHFSLDSQFAMADVAATPASGSSLQKKHEQALEVIDQVIDRLGNGKPFDCMVSQRTRTADREISGVGRYIQMGMGTGQFRFNMEVHDGDGEHTLDQISDGRLTWTRTQIGDEVTLSRVDVGWLDEGARALQLNSRIKPSMKVGALGEMLDTIRDQYDLSLGTSQLKGRPLVVVIGTLKQSRRDEMLSILGGQPWPETYPTRINIAIAQQDDPETKFGKGLPIRIEHLGELPESKDASGDEQPGTAKAHMISLLEFYSIRPTNTRPVDGFRFDNQNTDIDFVNETARYEQKFGIHVSAKERQRYR
ncbi:hypothetical protein LOC67_25525 [Stieleria sp. JC731]|uniref:hypothetical protein n=1 Tax=Pirellulaceae TaxID=2691357 RepID=UPI001E3189FE|nr:hypothetical protein [Stieleria sp. JC731]MCC9603927.1 hypothetical protein [Stieleria sp. JC731]